MELTDIQKGYIAGFIDGEGYIGLSKSPNKYNPLLSIGVTNLEVLEILKSILRAGYIRECKRYHITDSKTWAYTLTATKLREILPVITPYLIIKQRQACLMNLYFSYFKADDRDAMKGLKAVIKDKFHRLFKQLNSRGNRKRGEFKENLSEATLSQALEEIREKVQRLESDVKDMKKHKIIETLKRDGKRTKCELMKCHYFNMRKQENNDQFDSIMNELEKIGVVDKVHSKYNPYGFSYIYTGNDSTSALPERDDIIRTAQRCAEKEDKELL